MTTEQPKGAPIRVLLVEDHELVREGLIVHLEQQRDIEIVGEAASVEAAIEAITATCPDVAVLDVQLPDGTGIELCRRIRTISPSTKCIIHTSAQLDPRTAASAGAAAVVPKQLAGDPLIEAIRKTAGNDR